ncbi:hypothetical protein C8R44DRAFT_880619 [Mycena epipterygia]|nr:hypothetical protein C8R44DRAFT_880619 [Mycena epipterygia]
MLHTSHNETNIDILSSDKEEGEVTNSEEAPSVYEEMLITTFDTTIKANPGDNQDELISVGVDYNYRFKYSDDPPDADNVGKAMDEDGPWVLSLPAHVPCPSPCTCALPCINPCPLHPPITSHCASTLFLFGPAAGANAGFAPTPAPASTPGPAPAPAPAPAPVNAQGNGAAAATFTGFPLWDVFLACPLPTTIKTHTRMPLWLSPAPADLLTTSKHQPNNGNFPAQVISIHKCTQNGLMNYCIIEVLHKYMIFSIINGGPDKFNEAPDLIDQTYKARLDLTMPEKCRSSTSARLTRTSSTVPALAKHSPPPPWCVVAYVPNPIILDQLVTVSTYMTTVPCVCSIYTKDTSQNTEHSGEHLCWVFTKRIWTTLSIHLAIDHLSPVNNNACLLKMMETIEVWWDLLMKALVVYMHPCMMDAKSWEGVVDLICEVTIKKQLEDVASFMKFILSARQAWPDMTCAAATKNTSAMAATLRTQALLGGGPTIYSVCTVTVMAEAWGPRQVWQLHQQPQWY